MTESIDLASAALLGAVQGATEFLPVSSSGHVALGALLLGQDRDAHHDHHAAPRDAHRDRGAVLGRSDGARCAPTHRPGCATTRSAWAATDEGRTVLGMILSRPSPPRSSASSLKDSVEAGAHIPFVLGPAASWARP